ncbi:MAG TPA: tRNA lysidine(34) synthetase TilS [Gemmatimonadales bacterium]
MSHASSVTTPAPATTPLPAPLRRALDRALGRRSSVVLAVSGGLDSMVLMHAVAAWRPAGLAVTVATFDHGTGDAATKAARLVRREARGLGLPVVAGRAWRAGRNEDEWRRARWRFLRRVARRAAAGSAAARVATAHTRDDQVETVVLRLLRGSGVRGLAALLAPSPVIRPLLDLSRAYLAAVAAARSIPFVEDPSNADRRHLRNRVRLDLIPAARMVRPTFDEEMLETARSAARWRREVERAVDALGPRRAPEGGICVARGALTGYSPGELALLWPALAARAGVRLDRRGTHRLAAFTNSSDARAARIPLAGGGEVLALPHRWVVRRRVDGGGEEVPLAGTVRFGRWKLHPVAGELEGDAVDDAVGDPWRVALPADSRLSVRAWRPGDRIAAARRGGDGERAARRVKRHLADAGIPGPVREGWPVVLVDGEIAWIPGVCRSGAATARPGRPAVYYQCDRIGS